jgi:hypothetical protein
MTKDFPYLALDSAGERTILCDRPQDGCSIGGMSRKERGYARDDTSKEKRMARKMLSNDQLSHYVGTSIKNPAAADRYWAKCMGRDSAVDDETAARIKEFLSDKLSDKDHTKLCSMLDGTGDVEAQDTEPPSGDPEEKPTGRLASDAKARDDFTRMFPDAAKIGIDTSGIPLRGRSARHDAADATSFAAMFPDAARIKVL